MLVGIGQAFDKGNVEGILNTPKTFVEGLRGYLDNIWSSVNP